MIISFPGKTLSSNTMHEMDNILPPTKWIFQKKKWAHLKIKMHYAFYREDARAQRLLKNIDGYGLLVLRNFGRIFSLIIFGEK